MALPTTQNRDKRCLWQIETKINQLPCRCSCVPMQMALIALRSRELGQSMSCRLSALPTSDTRWVPTLLSRAISLGDTSMKGKSPAVCATMIRLPVCRVRGAPGAPKRRRHGACRPGCGAGGTGWTRLSRRGCPRRSRRQSRRPKGSASEKMSAFRAAVYVLTSCGESHG